MKNSNLRTCLAAVFLTVCVAVADAAPRLAIIDRSQSAGDVVDVLTATYSQTGKVELLERQELESISREWNLASSGSSFVELGRVLGADGLLLLERVVQDDKEYLSARLVATKPGAIIDTARVPWPVSDLVNWADGLRARHGKLIPKLSVKRADAVPISVVGIRSGSDSGVSDELERQLRLLVVERLVMEREIFVLERRSLNLLDEENARVGLDEGSFWSGSYLLAGEFDRDGYSADQLVLDVRLVPPGPRAPIELRVESPRTNTAALIDGLVSEIIDAVGGNKTAVRWNPADEARKFLDEARWALRWNMIREAQAASETAWALGLRTREVAYVRIQTYALEIETEWESIAYSNPILENAAPNPAKLVAGIRALQLFEHGFNTFLNDADGADSEWYSLLITLLTDATVWLDRFYLFPAERAGHEVELAELRELAKRMSLQVWRHPHYHELNNTNEVDMYSRTPRFAGMWFGKFDLGSVMAAQGAAWAATPEGGIGMYQNLVQAGQTHKLRKFAPRREVMDWVSNDEARCERIWTDFVNELCLSTNGLVQTEGMVLRFANTRHRTNYFARLDDVFRTALDNVEEIHARQLQRELYQDLRRLKASPPYPLSVADLTIEAGKRIRQFSFDMQKANRRSEMVSKIAKLKQYASGEIDYDESQFGASFRTTSYNKSEALELLPFIEKYRLRIVPAGADLERLYWKGITREQRQVVIFEKELQSKVAQPTTHTVRQTTELKNEKPRKSKILTPNRLVNVTRFWSFPEGTINPARHTITPESIVLESRYRDGKLWLQAIQGVNEASVDKAFIFGVNLSTFDTTVIPLPLRKKTDASAGGTSVTFATGDSFEVQNDHVYFCMRDTIKRYSLKTREWQDLPIPIRGVGRLSLVGDRLFVSTKDSILEILNDGNESRLLASARRRPARNVLDALNSFGHTYLFGANAGKVNALVGGKIYSLDAQDGSWTERAVLPDAANGMSVVPGEQGTLISCDSRKRWRDFLLWDHGDQQLKFLTRVPATAIRRGPGKPQPLPHQPVPDARWQFPEGMNLFDIRADFRDDTLWCFGGNLGMKREPSGEGIMIERDGVHARLIKFGSDDSVETIPLWFTLRKGIIPPELLQTMLGTVREDKRGHRVETRHPGRVTLRAMPDGVVILARNLPGFWLVSSADLQPSNLQDDPTGSLQLAVESNDRNGVKTQIDAGADIEIRNHRGWTPLITAIRNRNLQLAALLIDKGADVNARSTSQTGSTVLCFAAEHGDAKLVQQLIKHGADPNLNSNTGIPPLYFAAINGDTKIVEALVEAGSEVDYVTRSDRNGNSYTPLIGAVGSNHPAVVRILLNAGANIELAAEQEYTPLMVAAMFPPVRCLKLLVERGADVNAIGPFGRTALILAAYHGRTESVEFLIEQGADVRKVAFMGSGEMNALEAARKRGHKEIETILTAIDSD